MIKLNLMMEVGESPKAKEIVLLLAAGALISASIIMPGLPLAVKPFLPKKEWWKKYNQRKLKQTIKRFQKAGLISTKVENGEVVLRLTDKGKEKVLKYKIDDLKIPKPKVWDRKWRLVIFDIPNSKKIAREIFRDKLKQLGFYRLQESVFIHPFECFDEIEFLRQNFDIKNDVEILQIAKLENEEFYRNKFGLE